MAGLLKLVLAKAKERNASYAAPLSEFRLDMGLPIWRYQIDDVVLEKRSLPSHTGKIQSILPTACFPMPASLKSDCGR